jgi:hypothetical protein
LGLGRKRHSPRWASSGEGLSSRDEDGDDLDKRLSVVKFGSGRDSGAAQSSWSHKLGQRLTRYDSRR